MLVLLPRRLLMWPWDQLPIEGIMMNKSRVKRKEIALTRPISSSSASKSYLVGDNLFPPNENVIFLLIEPPSSSVGLPRPPPLPPLPRPLPLPGVRLTRIED